MGYAFCADVVVVLHAAYASFIVLGQLAIPAGVCLKWNWIRNFWFRVTHLLAIAIVAVEALLNITCPLTDWEARLRVLAGQHVSGESFIGRWMDRLLFYDPQPWVLTTLHVGFAVLVLVTFVLAPPRWRRVTVPTSQDA